MFDYVASGLSHTRITTEYSGSHSTTQMIVKDISSSVQDHHNHKISVLYNAYTEEKFSQKIPRVFGPEYKNIYSDSGGLQILTLGKQFTPELKRRIYRNQGLYSDFAMSFDEIPIENVSSSTSITSKNNKVYNSSLLNDYAKKSGNNLKEQIQIFQELGTDRRATILPIIQGNTIQGCKDWFYYLFDPLTEDERAITSGLSFSMAAYGIGIKEELERIILMEELKEFYSHCHLLGISSIQRFLPLLILKYNGFLKNVDYLSYDSTSLTSNITRGRYLDKKGQQFSLGRFKNPIVTHVVEDMLDNIKEFNPGLLERYSLDLNEDVLYATICQPSKFESSIAYPKEYLGVYNFLFYISQAYNFIRLFNNSLESKSELENLISKYGYGFSGSLFSLLENVHSIEEYVEWESHVGSSLKSRKITHKSTIDFNSMFD